MSYIFKTLNYLGSKLRLLDFIEENVRKVTDVGSGVCDLFAGSGCVSYKLSSVFPIVSCDIQYYSTVICNALLHKPTISKDEFNTFISDIYLGAYSSLVNGFSPLIAIEEDAIKNKKLDVLTDIIEHGSLEVFNIENSESLISLAIEQVNNNLMVAGLMNKESLISRYYGGVYFSYYQAVQIDVILAAIRNHANENIKDVLLAALLSTASDIVDTVGKHFAQPIKARDSKGNIKPLVLNKALKDKTIDVFALYKAWLYKYIELPRSEFQHNSIQCDFLDCLNNLPEYVHTIYADPPYTRDHYSRFYHVLETIALDDIPNISTVKKNGEIHVSNGIYRQNRHQSPFCIRSKAPNAFNDMFRVISTSNRNLILSYSPYDETKKSHPRVVTIEQLVSWAKNYFNNVEIVSPGHFSHNKLNSSEHLLASSDEAEMLIICTS